MNAEICADVVISGGGSCRAVRAARLSEDPALQLCLLDAGAWDPWTADRGLLGHAHSPGRQHQRAGSHDCRKGRGIHSRGFACSLVWSPFSSEPFASLSTLYPIRNP